MVDERSQHDADDERDDMAALDFRPPEVSDDSVLDALDGYGPGATGATEPPLPVATVTNPPGTVSVSALSDGRISRIKLSPRASGLTEAKLAEEVLVVAGLASQDAKSTQYVSMLEGMRQQGHDDAATRDFLTRDLGLPSPEQARAERTRVFRTRYAGDHD
ncbi:secretion protein EspD [Mycobacterium sp. 852014-52144_SCH5372336]|uniref:secretion protein EspD n=1 Tax=Mycobacterium sp. 852014-52144_SCH5372336 TaxID=1834115 RepID=UPI0007FD03BB|nr:secretion protein EspD [Mycobacterium sp. 852014-52144_SCH5372336]OBB74930.1 secretion protein EspD [Mycobacterium sp. 852014-52144_SCH5372336]